MDFGSRYPTLAPLGLILDFAHVFLTSARSRVMAFFSSAVRPEIREISTCWALEVYIYIWRISTLTQNLSKFMTSLGMCLLNVSQVIKMRTVKLTAIEREDVFGVSNRAPP